MKKIKEWFKKLIRFNRHQIQIGGRGNTQTINIKANYFEQENE